MLPVAQRSASANRFPAWRTGRHAEPLLGSAVW